MLCERGRGHGDAGQRAPGEPAAGVRTAVDQRAAGPAADRDSGPGGFSRPWRDAARTAVIVATGPTAGDVDFGLVADWPCLVVNDGYRLHAGACALYACDGRWWDIHIARIRETFRGALWTQDIVAAGRYGLNRIAGQHRAGLSTNPAEIHFNHNSGAQAINLAYHWGARRLVLVGFDMQEVKGKTHFFGPHPKPLQNSNPYDLFRRCFGTLAHDLAQAGVQVVNTSPRSALHVFPKATLADALA